MLVVRSVSVVTWTDAGRLACELREQLLDAVHDADRVRAGLPLDIDDDRRDVVHPGGLSGVFNAVDDAGDVLQEDRRAVAIGDDDVVVIAARGELIVGVDLVGLPGAVQRSLRGVDARLHERGAKRFERDAVRRERDRIGLNAHGRLLTAADADQTDTAQLRQLRRETRVDEILDLRQRHRRGRDRERQNRRVGGIGLAVDRRRRQVGWEITLGRVDRGLHLLLRDVDVEAQRELENDHRRAAGARRRHLVQPRHLAELAFQRRRDGGGHDVGARAGIEGEHLDRRVVDLRQRRHGKLRVGDEAGEQHCRHQQRGRDRTLDEDTRRAHRRHLDPGVVPEPLEAAVGQHVTWFETLDGGDAGVRHAGRDGAHVRGIPGNDVDECLRAVVLNGGRGDQHRSCTVRTRSRVLTNWLGKSSFFLLSNCARRRTVPVVVSIWLSMAMSSPVARVVDCARSRASTRRRRPPACADWICGEIVLGDREDDRHRLHLRQHDERGRRCSPGRRCRDRRGAARRGRRTAP